MDKYTPKQIGNFWNKVQLAEPNECWNWTASTNGNGYGHLRIQDKDFTSSRLAYELVYGEIPNRLLVCHHCDNRLCCNPQHLFLGTHADNTRDMIQKGRQVDNSGANSGMTKLTQEQVEEIQARYIQGGISQRALAKEYGISHMTVSFIFRNKHWRQINAKS